MRPVFVLALLVGCTAGKITVGDAAPDTDLTSTADTDPPVDSDPGASDTDSGSAAGDTDFPDHHTPAWDDDGDCHCEIAPCTGSITPGCEDLLGGDCDDGRNDVFPGAVETCNGRDDNCTGGIDEAGAIGGSTFHPDQDGDGYGAPGPTVVACAPPPGTVANGDDCFDDNADAHPGAIDWHAVDRGDGSFDYDCDQNEAKQSVDSYFCYYHCVQGWVDGWIDQVPACGDSGDRATGCQLSCQFSPTMRYCEPTADGPSVQACR